MSDQMVETPAETLQGLEEIERRVLWLSSLIVHDANKIKDPAGIKVGGHQASSASCVSLLTALYFRHLTCGDRIAVKPHASPVLYAIQYLLGRIPQEKLHQLRSFHGLQAYPSQTKDPDFVDYSTGSVGLGAAAVNFSALTAHFLRSKGLLNEAGNFWAVVGDAELDEGNVWEALAEPLLDDVPGIRWVVDLNRQSLDRVVPGIRVRRLEKLFDANGWRVIEAKYGRLLTGLFDKPGGESLMRRIDEMSNEEFQSIVSGPLGDIGERLINTSDDPRALSRVLSDLSPVELRQALTNLGGHDQEVLATSFQAADSRSTPAVVFAYTVKGWGLPFAGDPLNHSALMSPEQLEDLALSLRIGNDWYERPDPSSAGGRTVEQARARLARVRPAAQDRIAVPTNLDTRVVERTSSQEVFGRALTELARNHRQVASRVVTAAPDVSISTNLAGWINKMGSWRTTPSPQYGDASRLLRWNETTDGQHLELGISEMNLFGLLGQLGLSAKTFGPALAPIGTVYDTFISRGLDALVYGLYCGSSFVLVGTPSGISLAPEGGAHQSTVTPGLGVSLPGLLSYEPCFTKEVEWTLLEGIARALHQRGSTYLRLSTLPIDQGRFPAEQLSLRRQVLDGAYRLIDRRPDNSYVREHAVLIFATGVAIPGACQASDALLDEGIFASVINVTSADQLFRRWDSAGTSTIEEARHQPNPFPDLLSDEEIGIPALIVADGHPHNLAFLGTALNVRSISIGVSGFGESGTVGDLFRKHHLDPDSLVNAAVALVDRPNIKTGAAR
ncbi:MAG TPA: 1-deoxy-D-xylulose-5-phosphate synthase N-terminal domain-containing protein [Acidimicrobiia bacterium]|nr:1-deoxy-D-xylulose-5-phosphate synthase N-terminal domain-containing protein [Acidimicrobiia bacterium]